MENQLTNRTQSKRSKDLIYFSCKLSPISQDIIQLFTTQITDEDTELHSYKVRISDIEKKLEKRLNPEVFKTLEEELFKPVFEFKNGAITDKFGWCSKLSRDDDERTLTIQMHPELKEHLIGLKQNKVSFTIIDSEYFLKLKNTYSKRLYTIFKYWAGIATDLRKNNSIEVNFKIEEFVNLLRLTPSLSLYKNMKNRVLLTAIEEINKCTDIEVILNETKKSDSINSKVTELNFIVNNKEKEPKPIKTIIGEPKAKQINFRQHSNNAVNEWLENQ